MSWLFKSCWYFVCICLGDLCPSGTYCPLGSSAGTNCPPGTYLNTTGAVSEADCQTCIQGSYCSGYGNVYPTAQCDTGYYCPTGMNVSNPSEYTCPQGQCSSWKVSNDSFGKFKVYVKTKVFPLFFFLLFWNIYRYTVTAISWCTDVHRMNFQMSEIPIFKAPSIQIKIIWNYLLVFRFQVIIALKEATFPFAVTRESIRTRQVKGHVSHVLQDFSATTQCPLWFSSTALIVLLVGSILSSLHQGYLFCLLLCRLYVCFL